jgi:hypothetical protein
MHAIKCLKRWNELNKGISVIGTVTCDMEQEEGKHEISTKLAKKKLLGQEIRWLRD